MNARILAVALRALGLGACVTILDAPGDPVLRPASAGAWDNPPAPDLIASGPARTALNPSEQALYALLIDYRRQHGCRPSKSPNPYHSSPSSMSSTWIAMAPVGSAHNHSWSSQGPWRAVHYTPDHRQPRLSWSKPRELTLYPRRSASLHGLSELISERQRLAAQAEANGRQHQRS